MQLGLGDIENVPSRHHDNQYVDMRLKPRRVKVMISRLRLQTEHTDMSVVLILSFHSLQENEHISQIVELPL